MTATRSLSSTQAIVYGTLVVATLDGLDAIIVSIVRGSNPARMFRGIASGLLGQAALEGGLATAALGIAIHVFIAFAVVLTYYVASRRVSVLRQHPLICGPLYGVLVYLFMYRVVIPLSAIGVTPPFVFPRSINDVLIHAFGVGLPSAWFASRSGVGVRTDAAPPLSDTPVQSRV